jgi:hypothetical protein
MCPLVSGPFNSLFSYGNSPFYEHHRRDLRVINQEPATGRILTVNDVEAAVRGGSVSPAVVVASPRKHRGSLVDAVQRA